MFAHLTAGAACIALGLAAVCCAGSAGCRYAGYVSGAELAVIVQIGAG